MNANHRSHRMRQWLALALVLTMIFGQMAIAMAESFDPYGEEDSTPTNESTSGTIIINENSTETSTTSGNGAQAIGGSFNPYGTEGGEYSLEGEQGISPTEEELGLDGEGELPIMPTALDPIPGTPPGIEATISIENEQTGTVGHNQKITIIGSIKDVGNLGNPAITQGMKVQIVFPSYLKLLSDSGLGGWLDTLKNTGVITQASGMQPAPNNNICELEFTGNSIDGSMLELEFRLVLTVDATMGGSGETVKLIFIDHGNQYLIETGGIDIDDGSLTDLGVTKRFWGDNVQNLGGGLYKIIDKSKPVQYMVNLKMPDVANGTIKISDTMSDSLMLCDANGNAVTQANISSAIVFVQPFPPGTQYNIILTSNGFDIDITPPFTGGDYRFYYYAKLKSETAPSVLDNKIAVYIDGEAEYIDEAELLSGDSTVRFVSKKLLVNGNYVDEAALIEGDNGVFDDLTFYIVISQYQESINPITAGTSIVTDTLNNYFTFKSFGDTSSTPFTASHNSGVITVSKNGVTEKLKSGKYYIPITVSVNPSYLAEGMSGFNKVMDSTVYIYRNAKLIINKAWAQGAGNPQRGTNVTFRLVNSSGGVVAEKTVPTTQAEIVLPINYLNANLRNGTNTYTLKEIVANDSDYSNLPDRSVTITKDTTNRRVLVGDLGEPNLSGRKLIDLDNVPDDFFGEITFVKHKQGEVNTRLTGGRYKLYMVSDRHGATVGQYVNFSVPSANAYTYVGISAGGTEFTMLAADGTLLKGLPYGQYKLYELEAPTGYITPANNDPNISVTLGKTSKYVNTNVPNDFYAGGKVAVYKYSGNESARTPLNGVSFTLQKLDSGNWTTVQTKQTNSSGYVEFTNLSEGKYRLREVIPFGYVGYSSSPVGYRDVEFEIKQGVAQQSPLVVFYDSVNNPAMNIGQTVNMEWYNTMLYGSLEVTKTGKESLPLQDVKFELYSGTSYTDPSKKVKFTQNGSNYTYSTSGTITELVTGADGKFSVLNLPYGTYTLLETTTVTGHVLPSTPYWSITINKDLTTQSINNTARFGELHILKRGQVAGTTYSNLQGVDFALKTASGAIVKSGTTDVNGKIDWTGIPEGTYYLHETATVNGFKLISAITTVVIGGGDADTFWIKFLNIDNDRILQDIKVIKKDENGDALAGAKFKLSGKDFSNRDFSQEVTTNSAGEAVFTSVPFSSSAGYTLSETEAPQGYSKAADQQIVFTSERTTPLTIEISDLPFKLRVVKTGVNGNTYLTGAKFIIKAPSGQYVTATGTASGVYKYAGTVAAEASATEFVTVGTGGQFEITHMPAGVNYSIIETEPPTGYNKLTTPTYFTISDSSVDQLKVYTATISNSNIVGGIRILKLDEKSSFMEGIEFTISGPSGTQTKATNSQGEVVFTNLLYGTYTITEADPNNRYPGYDMSFTTTVNVHTNGQVEFVKVVNEKLTGKVTIFKHNFKSVGLQGAVFTLYPVDASGNIVKTGYKLIAVSGSDGKAEFANIPYGIYAIEETTPPPGYVKSNDTHYVNIGNASVPAGITISANNIDWANEQIKGSLKLYKSDGTNFLTGAKFKLTDADGTLVTLSGTIAGQYIYDEAGTILEFTTDAAGYALIEQLPYGAYKLIETEPPTGYVLDSTPYNFFITTQGAVIQREHVNRAELGMLRIYKHDNSDNTLGLLGAVIRIYNRKAGVQTPALYENSQYIAEAVTGPAGFVYVKDIPFGDYVAIEVIPPTGYHLGNDTLKEFTINSTNISVVYDIKFGNDKVDYKLIINKVDADDNLVKLAGAKFKVINTDTNWGPDPNTLVTNNSGKIELTGLGAGTYEITELEAPRGYVKDNRVFTVKLGGAGGDEDSDGKVEVTAENEKILGKVELLKIDEKDAQLNGAKFRLQDSAGNTLKLTSLGAGEYEYDANGTVTEFNAGKITIDKLPEGDYEFFEISPPTGYVKLGEKYAFSVTGTNFKSIIKVEAQNLPIKSSLAVRKVDESNENLSLPGAVFELLESKDNGATYASTGITKTTNSAGYVYFTDLMPGYYRISEKTAPAGYLKWTGSIDFRVLSDGSITMGANNTALKEENGVFVASISNRKIEHEFVVRKQDSSTGGVLQGAVFSLTGGSVSHTLVTGSNGLTSAVKLPVGTYTLTEISAPSGYMLSNTTYSVVVSETGITVNGATVSLTAPYTVIINNTPVTTNVVLYKTNSSTNSSLSGASFSVTKRNSTTSYSLYSGQNGLSNVITLTPGVYDIIETTTPTGFTRPLSGWTITVSNDGVVSASGSGINVYSNYGAVVINISNTPTSNTTTPTPTPTGGGGGGGGGSTIPLNSGSASSDDPIPLGPGLPQTGQARRSGEMLIASLAILISLVALMIFVVQDKQLSGSKRQLLPSLV